MHILVTGANGFIGTALVKSLTKAGHMVRAGVRNQSGSLNTGSRNRVEFVNLDITDKNNDYEMLLKNIDIVIHLAARVHFTHKSKSDKEIYKLVNLEATRVLLNNSIRYGVKRFVFLSSIKVSGEGSSSHAIKSIKGYSENDLPDPQDEYAKSKYAAEQVITETCKNCKTEYVILRTPLVYGPGVKGNFLLLMNAVKKRYPLPLAHQKNRRSLIYLENLCGGIIICATNPLAANNLFHIADVTIMVPELIKILSKLMRVKPFMFPVPLILLKITGALLNKKGVVDRLTESLVVDDSKIRKLLSWTPAFPFDYAVAETVKWYNLEHGNHI